MFMQFFIERAEVVTLKGNSGYLYFVGVNYFQFKYSDGVMAPRESGCSVLAIRENGFVQKQAGPLTGRESILGRAAEELELPARHADESGASETGDRPVLKAK